MSRNEFTALERIGREYLDLWCRNKPFDIKAYEALRDFIRFGFYRNRRDELADRYIQCAQTALDEVWEESKKDFEILQKRGDDLVITFKKKVQENFSERKPVVRKKAETHPTDDIFLRSVCRDFIPRLRDYAYNVRKLCQAYFEKRDLQMLYDEIIDVKGVGPKIASLFLRDMLLLYGRQHWKNKKWLETLSGKEMELVYPVDTWVEQIQVRLMRVSKTQKHITTLFIKKCEDFGVNALYVNHGMWFVGAKARDFLLDNLGKIEGFRIKTL